MKYKDTQKLYEEIKLHREIANDKRTVKVVREYHEQIANWLEELDNLRNSSKISYYTESIADPVKEYNKTLKELYKERAKNKKRKQIDSNVECLIIDKLVEIIGVMNLQQLKQIELFQ